MAKKITELNEGTFIEPSKVTLKDYLNHWLEIKSMSIEKVPLLAIGHLSTNMLYLV